MKQVLKKTGVLTMIVFLSLGAFAQQKMLETIAGEAYGKQYPLLVGKDRTTILVFPFKIATQGVDVGSADILVSPMGSTDNIMRVKAAKENFSSTNLTIVTTDGKLWSFYVCYSAFPDTRPIDMGKQENAQKPLVHLQDRTNGDAEVASNIQSVAKKKPFLKKPKVKSYGVQLALKGIYSDRDMLYFQLELKNKTAMDHEVESSRFYVRDAKRAKRTAWQEKEIKPLQLYLQKGTRTMGKSRQYIVVAFKKFTIADHKQFAVQLFEKSGDHFLELKMDGKKLMQARSLHASDNSYNSANDGNIGIIDS